MVKLKLDYDNLLVQATLTKGTVTSTVARQNPVIPIQICVIWTFKSGPKIPGFTMFKFSHKTEPAWFDHWKFWLLSFRTLSLPSVGWTNSWHWFGQCCCVGLAGTPAAKKTGDSILTYFSFKESTVHLQWIRPTLLGQLKPILVSVSGGQAVESSPVECAVAFTDGKSALSLQPHCSSSLLLMDKQKCCYPNVEYIVC